MCPMCIRSKTPWHWTTVRPLFSRRRSSSTPASASMSLTLLVGATRGTLRGQELEPLLRRLGDRGWIPDRRFTPVVNVGHHDLHALFKCRFRPPAEDAADLRCVG